MIINQKSGLGSENIRQKQFLPYTYSTINTEEFYDLWSPRNVCMSWNVLPSSPTTTSSVSDIGWVSFNSIITLSTWIWWQIPQDKDSVPWYWPLLPMPITISRLFDKSFWPTDQLTINWGFQEPLCLTPGLQMPQAYYLLITKKEIKGFSGGVLDITVEGCTAPRSRGNKYTG